MKRCFHGCKPFVYPVLDPTLFVLKKDHVAWYLPDEAVKLEDVAVDLTWLPMCLTQEVMAHDHEFCITYGVGSCLDPICSSFAFFDWPCAWHLCVRL